MSRTLGPALAALLAALLASACAPAPGPGDRAAGAPLVIGLVGVPASISPDDPAGAVVWAMVNEPLVRRSATEDLRPRLVVSIPSYAAGDLALVTDADAPAGRLVATFRLRRGLTWQDGAPLTAHDVSYAFERDRTAAIGSEERAYADRIAGIEVVDDRTFRVYYRAGERWDDFALGPRALPRHLLAGATPAQEAAYAAQPVGAGPYRIARRTADAIVLEAFDAYVGGRPPIGRVVVRSFPDRQTLLAAVRAGQVDVAPSPDFEADLYATLDRTFDGPAATVRYTPAQAVAMLRFGPRLRDPALRRAVALAVDRARIARSVFGGRARVPDSYLVPPLWAASDRLATAHVDLAAAREILRRAGFRSGGFGVRERGRDRLVVSLIVPPSPALAEAARAVAVDLAALGIAADVSELPAAEVARRVAAGTFDLALEVENGDDPLIAAERWRGHVSPWFDVLAEAARQAEGRADKRALYLETQRLWWDEAAALPLYQVLKVDVVPGRLEGVRPAASGMPLTWDAGEWRWP